MLAVIAACEGGAQQPPPASPATPAPAVATASQGDPAPTPGATASAVAPPPAPSAPTSAVATVKSVDTWVDCHRTYQASLKDVSKDVAAMAASCKGITKFNLVGNTLTGKQADRDAPQAFPLEAHAGHCYRVYAQSSEGIKDLDLIVKDSSGVVIGQDSTDDPSPVAMEYGALCFTRDDRASIVVAVGAGQGDYALQVWSD